MKGLGTKEKCMQSVETTGVLTGGLPKGGLGGGEPVCYIISKF